MRKLRPKPCTILSASVRQVKVPVKECPEENKPQCPQGLDETPRNLWLWTKSVSYIKHQQGKETERELGPTTYLQMSSAGQLGTAPARGTRAEQDRGIAV